MAEASPSTTSAFLELPVELRLQIYSEAILDCKVITVGTAKLKGAHSDIVHRLYGDDREPCAGIPQHHEPVIDTKYNASLLSHINPAIIPLTPATLEPPAEACDYTRTAYHTLLRLCKQVNNEIRHHFTIPARRQTSLFVQFPYGLHVLHSVTPQLVRQSRSVHLAGAYIPTSFSSRRAACLGPRRTLKKERLNADILPNFKSELDDLVLSMFGPNPVNPVEKLEMRIYYPGEDSYSTVWGDDGSPTVIALRNICAGDVSIEVWRGRHATGVYLTARPIPGERKRVVSTVWRRLEEGRRGEPECGAWVVDPAWPSWSAEYDRPEGLRGDMIVTTPASS